ncbi:MAG: RNA polymerase sigma factor [Deltaproteobacteria bacterium]|nr:RNA polymerase sigma factor [Deltaproteobacteria bacterium]
MDPDLELLQRWRDGDRRAGGQLFDRHFNSVRAFFALKIPEADQDDLVQEVFARMVAARDRFEGRSTLRTYLLHIAQHVFYETLTRLHRPNGTFDPLSESLAQVTGRSGSSILAADELLQRLLDALQNIPIDKQDLITLHYFHELTYDELAEQSGVPLNTAKSRVGSARATLLGEFNSRLGPDVEPWTGAQLSQALKALRNVVLTSQPLPEGAQPASD